jgi:hypothetical protein
MKNSLLKFANQLLSKESMKFVKGGVTYCMKNGSFWGYFNSPQAAESAIIRDTTGGGSGTYNCW